MGFWWEELLRKKKDFKTCMILEIKKEFGRFNFQGWKLLQTKFLLFFRYHLNNFFKSYSESYYFDPNY